MTTLRDTIPTIASPSATALSCGLLGARLGHSYSQEIHRALGQYDYELCEVSEAHLRDFVTSRLRAPLDLTSAATEDPSSHGAGSLPPLLGCNVTIPYKQSIIPLLDEVDDLAQAIGAVNTVYRQPMDGTPTHRLMGTNTDLAGFFTLLSEGGLSLHRKHVLILGTGGASAMVRYAATHGGDQEHFAKGEVDAASVTVASRAPSSLVDVCDYQHLPLATQILVNCTPVGMYPEVAASPVDLTQFPHLEGVVDLIYNPAKTTLLLQAEDLGIPCIGGLSMLVAQAVVASRFFCQGAGHELLSTTDVETQQTISRITQALAREKQNIVLIGMPGSGKTSLGKDISKHTGRPFRDSDREILTRTGRKPSAIIQEDGEAAFRQIESSIIADLAKEHGQVIATGGGVVERKENLQALRRNGYILYLKKKLHALATKDRPLSQDRDALLALQARRTPLYENVADLVVDNNRYYKDTLAFVLQNVKETLCATSPTTPPPKSFLENTRRSTPET